MICIILLFLKCIFSDLIYSVEYGTNKNNEL